MTDRRNSTILTGGKFLKQWRRRLETTTEYSTGDWRTGVGDGENAEVEVGDSE